MGLLAEFGGEVGHAEGILFGRVLGEEDILSMVEVGRGLLIPLTFPSDYTRDTEHRNYE